MSKKKTPDRLDRLFEWFARTPESEELRLEALKAVGLEDRHNALRIERENREKKE